MHLLRFDISPKSIYVAYLIVDIWKAALYPFIAEPPAAAIYEFVGRSLDAELLVKFAQGRFDEAAAGRDMSGTRYVITRRARLFGRAAMLQQYFGTTIAASQQPYVRRAVQESLSVHHTAVGHRTGRFTRLVHYVQKFHNGCKIKKRMPIRHIISQTYDCVKTSDRFYDDISYFYSKFAKATDRKITNNIKQPKLC